MKIKTLSCVNFRNISKLSVYPDEGMNVICGENAQGKTNLIEAVWLFTGAKSFRSGRDSSLIRFGCDKAVTEMSFISSGVLHDARMEFGEIKKAFLNETALPSPASLAGEFNAIVFSPSDLSLITAGPAVRRRFLDTAIGQLYPRYIGILRNYSRALSQRNRIIREYRYDGSVSVMLDVFEKEIAENGTKMIAYRKRFLNTLNDFLPGIYDGLSSGREKLTAFYMCECEENDLTMALNVARKQDMLSGVTSAGPHRDDIQFEINGISARLYGSQGQKRSVALALKLSEAQVIKKTTGEYPVCLLDDVMSELDPERQNYVLNHIKGWQSFLTCCDPSHVKNLQEGRIFKINSGELVEV